MMKHMRWVPIIIISLVASLLGWFFVAHGSTKGVNYADAQDLLLAAYGRGLAHPPGYPLLVSVYRSIQLLFQLESVTIAGVLVSAASMTLATFVAMVLGYAYLEKSGLPILLRVLVGVSLVLIWLASPALWIFGMIPEVMPFSIVLLFLLGALIYWKSFVLDSLWYIWFGLLSSLVVLHHPLLIGIVGISYVWVFIYHARFRWQPLLYMVGGVGLGALVTLLTYVYLSQPVSYGWQPPQTLEELWKFWARLTYNMELSAVDMFATDNNMGRIIASIGYWWQWTASQLGIGLLALAGVGVVTSITTSKMRGSLLVMLLVFYGVIIPGYMKNPMDYNVSEVGVWQGLALRERMFYPLFTVLLLAAVLGVGYGASRFKSKKLILVMVVLMGVWGGFRVYTTASKVQLVNNNASMEYTKLVLEPLPDKSVLVVNGDDVFSLLYAQLIYGYRPDILVVPVGITLTPLWYGPNEYMYTSLHHTVESFVSDVVSWNIWNGRRVFGYHLDNNLLTAIGVEANPFYAIPYGYTIEISKEPPVTLGEFDYGLSVQIASYKVENADAWFKGFRTSLGSIHTQHAYFFYRNGMTKLAEFHEELAQSLRYYTSTGQTIRMITTEAQNRYTESGSFWAYVPHTRVDWIQAGETACNEGNQEAAAYFYSRAVLVEPTDPAVRDTLLQGCSL